MKKYIIFLLALLPINLTWSDARDIQHAKSYMSYLSSRIVLRPLNSSELKLLNNKAERAIEEIIENWTSHSNFPKSTQRFIEVFLGMNGSSDSTNYNLPGYLAMDIAKKNRPYKDIILANSCISKKGNKISCDTEAPYSAGVLTTKAYLKTAKGAYNISRAGKMTEKFLCETYPFPESEEPKLDASELIPQFATKSGKISFGNGNNCYSCHSQFGKHTQLFVKFNLDGKYIKDATGIQSEGAIDGFSKGNLLTSHFKKPERADKEFSEILGVKVNNLSEAAKVLANNNRFLPCAVQNMMRYYLRLNDQSIDTIKPDLYQIIATEATNRREDPSFSHILKAIVTNDYVYTSFKKSGARP